MYPIKNDSKQSAATAGLASPFRACNLIAEAILAEIYIYSKAENTKIPETIWSSFYWTTISLSCSSKRCRWPLELRERAHPDVWCHVVVIYF